MNRKTENYIKLVDKLKSEYVTLAIKCSKLRMKSQDDEIYKLLKDARSKQIVTEIKLSALMIAALRKSKKLSPAAIRNGYNDNQTYANAIKRSLVEKYLSLLKEYKINRHMAFYEWEVIPGTKEPNYRYPIYGPTVENYINILVRRIEKDISRGAVKRINNDGMERDIDYQLAEQDRKEGKRISR